MPGAIKVFRNLAFSLDGVPISTGSSKFEVKVSREKLPRKNYEDPGTLNEKGDYQATVALDGWGTDSEQKVLAGLADADEDNSSFLLLLGSDTRNSPHAAPGSDALAMTVRTFDVTMSREGGKIATFSANFENSDGHRPYFAKTLYTNRSRVPAPLGAGVVTPAPVTFPALVAGFEGFFTVHVTKITGTARVTVLAEILSDTPGFSSPAVAATFPLFVSDTPTGTDVLGPKSQTIYLDGDVTPIPSETQWTIRFTVTDAGTDGAVEIMAAGLITAK